jgi:hypothetical protein
MISAMRTTIPQALQLFSRTAEAFHKLERNPGRAPHIADDRES